MTQFQPAGPAGGDLGGGGPEIPEGQGWGRGSQGPYNPIGRDHTPQAPQMKHLDLTLSDTKIQEKEDGSDGPSDNLTTYVGKDQYGREWHWSQREYMDPEDWESWEISYVDQDGLWHGYREKDGNFYDTWTDKYGREWRSTEDAQGKTSLGYTDKDGLWHDTFEADGVWNDNWTDKNGTRWESFYDENGQHHVGYRDADGGWHDVDPISGAELNLEHHAEGLPGLEPPYNEQAALAPTHAKGGLPKLVEEPAPAPAPLQPDPDPDVQEHFAKDYGFPGLEEEPPAEQYPPADPPVQPTPPPPPFGIQEHYAESHFPEGHFPALAEEPAPATEMAEDNDLAKQQAEERERAEEEQGPQYPPGSSLGDMDIQDHYVKEQNIPELVEEPAPTPAVPDPLYKMPFLETPQVESRFLEPDDYVTEQGGLTDPHLPDPSLMEDLKAQEDQDVFEGF